MNITAVIITQNEERNIGRCLTSLQGVADEIVVVDSGSTDATERICREAGVRFEHHDWEGYSAQKNYATGLATCDWILSIDADEALSEELRASLTQLKQSDPDASNIYNFNRLANYCGHWIRHCGWYPDPCIRLWHVGTAQWDGMIHEELLYAPSVKLIHLDGDLLHYSYYSVADHVQRMARYAPMGAEKAYLQGKRCGPASMVFRPMWTFLRDYFLKGGFLDGSAGFVICRLSAVYTLVKYATLYNRTHEGSR